jgi:hypothetical protein
MIWKARFAFTLVLRCCCTERWHRMFIARSRCKASTTPSNVSHVGWLRASIIMKNTGQCRWPQCTRNSRTARMRQVGTRRRRLASGTRAVPRLVSSMPFRVCLELIKVAINRQVPPSLGEGRGMSVDYS